MADERPILIAGGGLGGLSAPLALGRHRRAGRGPGQAAKIAPVRHGVPLGPNVFPMFERLGITDAVMAEATIPKNILMLDALSGEEVTHIPTGAKFRARFTHPYIIIHREDIHRVLIDACAAVPHIAMEGGAEVVGFEDTGAGVRVALAAGRELEGPRLIGADGLRSAVRARLVVEGEPRPIGYVAHRTIRPMSDMPAHIPYRDEVVLWGGLGFHIVHYPLRHGTLFNIVAVVPPPALGEPPEPAGQHGPGPHTHPGAP